MKLGNLLLTRTSSLSIQFGRYVIVGGVAFCVDFLTLYLLTEYLYLHYLTQTRTQSTKSEKIHYYILILFFFGFSWLLLKFDA